MQTVETIYEEIVQYLKTCRSKIFDFDPREPREEVILRTFEPTGDERLKNKLRQAVYIAFEREELFSHGYEFIWRLLVLADEMKVTQAKNILLELARTHDFPGMPAGDKARLKNHIIAVLLKFDIPKEALKDIIDNNISDPDYTEICLGASTLLIPRFDSFVKYFPIALRQYRRYPRKVSLESVLRVCLDCIGKALWQDRGDQLLLCDLNHMAEILILFHRAGLEPLIYPVDSNETSFEFLVKWPFDDKTVPTYLFNLPCPQRKILQDAIIKSKISSPINRAGGIKPGPRRPRLIERINFIERQQKLESEEWRANLPVIFTYPI